MTDPSIDGEYTVIETVDRTHFKVASFPDDTLVDVVLNESRDYSVNGFFSITVLDVDTFTYTLPKSLGFNPTIDAGNMKVHYILRVRGASSIER